jgi:AbrB family looped-hinge helix DNA binding protein
MIGSTLLALSKSDENGAGSLSSVLKFQRSKASHILEEDAFRFSNFAIEENQTRRAFTLTRKNNQQSLCKFEESLVPQTDLNERSNVVRQSSSNLESCYYSILDLLQKSKIGSKGEIFPPKEIRERLGLYPGTEIDLKVEDSKLIVRVIPKVNDLLKQPPLVEISLEEFHKFRKDLSKKAESS